MPEIFTLYFILDDVTCNAPNRRDFSAKTANPLSLCDISLIKGIPMVVRNTSIISNVFWTTARVVPTADVQTFNRRDDYQSSESLSVISNVHGSPMGIPTADV